MFFDPISELRGTNQINGICFILVNMHCHEIVESGLCHCTPKVCFNSSVWRSHCFDSQSTFLEFPDEISAFSISQLKAFRHFSPSWHRMFIYLYSFCFVFYQVVIETFIPSRFCQRVKCKLSHCLAFGC